MTQTAPDQTAFDARNLTYSFRVDYPFCCFDAQGTTCIPVTLAIGKGAPLALYGEGEYPVMIGGRLFVNEGTMEAPQRGALIRDYRADSGPFSAEQGQHYARSMTVDVPAEAPCELLLDIDLVKEQCFWVADLGHAPLTLFLTSRRMAIRPDPSDPTDMTDALMRLHDARAREARYEAVIFSLLNQLPGQGG